MVRNVQAAEASRLGVHKVGAKQLEKDMIALAVGPPLRVAVVAAPAYPSDHPTPLEPADLAAHRCIAYRGADGELSPWWFERDGHAVTVTPGRGPVFNDGDLLVAAALGGLRNPLCA